MFWLNHEIPREIPMEILTSGLGLFRDCSVLGYRMLMPATGSNHFVTRVLDAERWRKGRDVRRARTRMRRAGQNPRSLEESRIYPQRILKSPGDRPYWDIDDSLSGRIHDLP